MSVGDLLTLVGAAVAVIVGTLFATTLVFMGVCIQAEKVKSRSGKACIYILAVILALIPLWYGYGELADMVRIYR